MEPPKMDGTNLQTTTIQTAQVPPSIFGARSISAKASRLKTAVAVAPKVNPFLELDIDIKLPQDTNAKINDPATRNARKAKAEANRKAHAREEEAREAFLEFHRKMTVIHELARTRRRCQAKEVKVKLINSILGCQIPEGVAEGELEAPASPSPTKNILSPSPDTEKADESAGNIEQAVIDIDSIEPEKSTTVLEEKTEVNAKADPNAPNPDPLTNLQRQPQKRDEEGAPAALMENEVLKPPQEHALSESDPGGNSSTPAIFAPGTSTTTDPQPEIHELGHDSVDIRNEQDIAVALVPASSPSQEALQPTPPASPSTSAAAATKPRPPNQNLKLFGFRRTAVSNQKLTKLQHAKEKIATALVSPAKAAVSTSASTQMNPFMTVPVTPLKAYLKPAPAPTPSQSTSNTTPTKASTPTQSTPKRSKIQRLPRLPNTDPKQERRQHYMMKLVLGGMDLDGYLPLFRRHGINYLDFLRLTSTDLVEMGIMNEEHRGRIFECIQSLSNEPRPGNSNGEGVQSPVTPASPLRIQRNGTVSPVMQIQMLNNIWTHLLTLVGRSDGPKNIASTKDANNNILVDKAGKEYTLGIAGLCTQIQKPGKFRLDYNIQIDDLVKVADSVLNTAHNLADEFRSFQSELLQLSKPDEHGTAEALVTLDNEGKSKNASKLQLLDSYLKFFSVNFNPQLIQSYLDLVLSVLYFTTLDFWTSLRS